MPQFRFQARHFTGEPVFGMRDAPSAAALTLLLEADGLLDVQIQPLQTISSAVPTTTSLPRLVQLRVGERLREALLLQLPAHEMLRAVADEPFPHPLLLIWPWLITCSLLFTLLTLPLTTVIPVFPAQTPQTLLGISALLILLGIFLKHQLQQRPRQLLRQLADELERGQDSAEALRPFLPSELQGLDFNGLDETRKTQLLAELLPTLGRLRLQRYRLSAALLGPFPFGILLTGGLALISRTLVRQLLLFLHQTQLASTTPGAERWLCGISLLACGILLSIVLVVGLMIFTGRCERVVRRLPLIGRSLIWLSQAVFCRVLAAQLRQGGAAAAMLRSAAAVTGGAGLRREAADIAAAIETGQSAPEANGRWLNGLPLALLTTPDGQSLPPKDAREVADAFDGMASALESASRGDAGFVALIISLALVIFGGLLLAAAWAVVLLPLIQMLDSLAVLLPPALPFNTGGLWA